MKMRPAIVLVGTTILGLAGSATAAAPAPAPAARAASSGEVASRTEKVDGMTFHYLTAGSGEPLLLIHGYAQSAHMWKAIIPRFARHFTVIAPDLPGFADSDIPPDGLDIKSAAVRVHELARALHVQKARVVGHDIGLMVAYAYASLYPAEVEKLVVLDAFLPGIGDWERTYHDPQLWHFFFTGPTPEALVKGRERTYFEHYWNDFAADKTRSLSEKDRRLYTAAFARPGRMRAGWSYFAGFPQTAREFAEMGKTKLKMPVLVVAGEKAAGEGLGRQLKLVATDVKVVVLKDTGHWVLEENPKGTTEALEAFLVGGVAAASPMRDLRLTPAEVGAVPRDANPIGSSKLAGVQTKVLEGDPTKPGLYSILLFVPPRTTIQAHSHRDDRMAVVVSGTWRFGYGDRFDARQLKELPPGSVYAEPGAGRNHFAQTGEQPVVVNITGFGPTDTRYFDPRDEPGHQASNQEGGR